MTVPAGKETGSLRSDGRRHAIFPADVKGRFTRRRNWLFAILIAIYVLLPWLQVGGHPAVFLDIADRKFFLFGLTFNAQDVWLMFFLVAGAALTLLLVTAMFGRIWCGYACPQTVFLEGVFRKIERWIDGPAAARKRRQAGPWTGGRVARALVKHAVYAVMATLVAHVFISYFVSLPALWKMMHHSPSEHLEAFVWVAALTIAMYGNFAWFREQMCVVVCPYGRLQSALLDRDSLIIGYDTRRGEPRGKLKVVGAGDCIDCGRCTAVCPTGIDIRDGLQMDCVGCAACIDACDAIMTRVGREPGLIRYDSQRGLEGQKRRFLRPRLVLYAVLATGFLVATGFGLRAHQPFEAHLLRLPGTAYVVEGERVRNSFELRLVNKAPHAATFTLSPRPVEGVEYTLAEDTIELASLASRAVPVFVRVDRSALVQGMKAHIDIRMDTEGKASLVRSASAPLIGPPR